MLKITQKAEIGSDVLAPVPLLFSRKSSGYLLDLFQFCSKINYQVFHAPLLRSAENCRGTRYGLVLWV